MFRGVSYLRSVGIICVDLDSMFFLQIRVSNQWRIAAICAMPPRSGQILHPQPKPRWPHEQTRFPQTDTKEKQHVTRSMCRMA